MIEIGLQGCEFVVGNTDAQALTSSRAHRVIQMGLQVTEGLGAGSQPEIGRAAAEEVIDEIRDQLAGAHMVFVTAGMGGGTGTGAAPVIARAARDMGILTVGVVTKPFQFEGTRRMRLAEQGISELQACVDTLIVIPNQNLFRVANEQTTFADAFSMADRVLYSGVACITDLMVKEGLINLDFADVRAVMREMGKAMMGTGEASGEKRALRAAEAAIANPLLDDVNMSGARGLLISITGGSDLTLYEVDEAATRIREEVDPDANVIFGATRDDSLEGIVRVSVVATGIDHAEMLQSHPRVEQQSALSSPQLKEAAERIRSDIRSALSRSTSEAQRSTPVADAPVQAAVGYVPSYSAPRSEVGQMASNRVSDLRSTSSFADPAMQSDYSQTENGAQQQFAPSEPERPVRAVRMPSINELPPIAQRSLESSQNSQPQVAPVERQKRSLMERLTNAGFGRRAEQQDVPQAPRSANFDPKPAVQVQNPAGFGHASAPTMTSYGQPETAPRHVEMAPRQAMAPTSRAQASDSRDFDEDQMEIPAFLRRQSN
jgi:cell division protein FtsZ